MTAGGKNVAPAVLEDRLRAHALVSQALVVGDRQPFIAALVTLDPDSFPLWAETHGKSGSRVADLVDDPDLLAEIADAPSTTPTPRSPRPSRSASSGSCPRRLDRGGRPAHAQPQAQAQRRACASSRTRSPRSTPLSAAGVRGRSQPLRELATIRTSRRTSSSAIRCRRCSRASSLERSASLTSSSRQRDPDVRIGASRRGHAVERKGLRPWTDAEILLVVGRGRRRPGCRAGLRLRPGRRGPGRRASSTTVEVLVATAARSRPGESAADAADTPASCCSQAGARATRCSPGSTNDGADFTEQVALTTIYPGEQILDRKVRHRRPVEAPSASPIPEGMIAISVNLDRPARVGGFTKPGLARWSIFVTGTSGDRHRRPTTRLLLDAGPGASRDRARPAGRSAPTTTDPDGAVDATATAEARSPRTLLTLALDQDEAASVIAVAAGPTASWPSACRNDAELEIGDSDHRRRSSSPSSTGGDRDARPRRTRRPDGRRRCSRRCRRAPTASTRADRMLAWLDQHPDEYVVVLGPEPRPRRSRSRSARTCASPGRPSAWCWSSSTVDTDVLYPRDEGRRPRRRRRPTTPTALATAVRQAHQLFVGPARARRAPQTGPRRSRSSPPRAASARPPWRSTWRSRSPTRGARKVCLVDLDLAFGDVAITMQLFPTPLHRAGHRRRGLLDLADARGPAHPAPGLPDGAGRAAAPRRPRAGHPGAGLAHPAHPQGGVRLRRGRHRARPSTTRSLTALDETDECVIIATLDVPTLKNVKVALETLEMLNIASGHRHLLLNRADDAVGHQQRQGRGRSSACRSAAQVSTSIDIAAATNAGTPDRGRASPQHPASAAIRELASHRWPASRSRRRRADTRRDRRRRRPTRAAACSDARRRVAS